jgi:hypothetical protein
MSTTSKIGKVECRETIGISVGARPIEYERRIVRNNRSGRLEEIDIHELPPVDPGDEGTFYVFTKGEQVLADHPAVAANPGAFVAVDD